MNHKFLKLAYFIFYLLIFTNETIAHAYIGPGMGGGLIAATLGIVLAIFAALVAIVWFPIKRILKLKKKKEINSENQNLNE